MCSNQRGEFTIRSWELKQPIQPDLIRVWVCGYKYCYQFLLLYGMPVSLSVYQFPIIFQSGEKHCECKVFFAQEPTLNFYLTMQVIDEPNGPKWERFCACLGDQGYFKVSVHAFICYVLS